jgi:hypothetical protein
MLVYEALHVAMARAPHPEQPATIAGSVNLRAIECIFSIRSIERNMRPILRTVYRGPRPTSRVGGQNPRERNLTGHRELHL